MSETMAGYECESCGESLRGIVEIIQHDCDPVEFSAESLSRKERNTLMYIENRVVDHGGKLDTAQMNYEDHQNIKLFKAAGLLDVAEPKLDPGKARGPHDVEASVEQVGFFTDEAWDIVRDSRQMRAEDDDRVEFPVQ